MRIQSSRFNLYLWVLLVAFVCAGCSSTSLKRRMTALDLHLELSRGDAGRGKSVPVYRSKPVMISISPEAFLSEGSVSKAKVIEAVGGFEIQIEFERRGSWILEQYTSGNRGRRIVIRADFPDPAEPKKRIERWIAAPMITGRIGTGMLTFTPDCSREEADEIVRGLNNLAKKLDDSW